jgi:hypothetical protein
MNKNEPFLETACPTYIYISKNGKAIPVTGREDP